MAPSTGRSKLGHTNSSKAPKSSNLVTFRPSAEAKRQLTKLVVEVSWDDVFNYISEYVQRGCNLTVGYDGTRGSHFCILREKLDDWSKAPAVSVWHSDFGRSLLTLFYYLKHVNVDFPEGVEAPAFNEDDW